MCSFYKNRLRHRILCCVIFTKIENTQTFFSQPFCTSFVLDCTNSRFYLLFTLTKKQSGYYHMFVYYNLPVKQFTKTVCFYGVQHVAGRIAIVWAVNNIQLYVSLFMRGLFVCAFALSCFPSPTIYIIPCGRMVCLTGHLVLNTISSNIRFTFQNIWNGIDFLAFVRRLSRFCFIREFFCFLLFFGKILYFSVLPVNKYI